MRAETRPGLHRLRTSFHRGVDRRASSSKPTPWACSWRIACTSVGVRRHRNRRGVRACRQWLSHNPPGEVAALAVGNRAARDAAGAQWRRHRPSPAMALIVAVTQPQRTHGAIAAGNLAGPRQRAIDPIARNCQRGAITAGDAPRPSAVAAR